MSEHGAVLSHEGGGTKDSTRAARVEQARKAHARGWQLTPLSGKRPILSEWESQPPPTEEQVRTWAFAGNVGLRTGRASGVVVVDVDAAKGGEIPVPLRTVPTVTVETGGGGLHLYYKCPPEGLRNSVGKLGRKVDVRGDKGQVVYVGSVHPDTRKTYTWAPGRSPDEIELAVLPKWALDVLNAPRERSSPPPRPSVPSPSRPITGGTRYGTEALAREVAAVAGAGEGTRNDTLNRAAFAIGQLLEAGHLADEYGAVEALAGAARSAGLGDTEIDLTITSGIAAGRSTPRRTMPDARASAPASRTVTRPKPAPTREPGEDDEGEGAAAPEEPPVAGSAPVPPVGDPMIDLDRTDLGNARRLALYYGLDLRFTTAHGWLLWDGVRWVQDDDGRAATAMAFKIADDLKARVTSVPEEHREPFWKHAIRSQAHQRISACVTLARSLPPIAAKASTFDGPETNMSLVCPNGVLDLATGSLRRPRREDHVTRMTPVRYDGAAECPTWEAFIERVFAGDRDLISFVQRAAGYSLTGSIRDQALFLCYGMGANGKSTLLSTLRFVLGEYARHADFSSFLATRSPTGAGGARSDLARLAGARFVTAVEPDDGSKFSESTLKAITGGDPITARYHYRAEFEYQPVLKLWLSANHKPRIAGTDEAIWRRIRLIPFLVTIPAAERVRDLDVRLQREAEGILAWCVRGCLAWQREGLTPPPSVVAATDEYRGEQDVLASWLTECCDVAAGLSESATTLFKSYMAWAKDNGESVWSQTRFGRALVERGLARSRDTMTRRIAYSGIALRGPIV